MTTVCQTCLGSKRGSRIIGTRCYRICVACAGTGRDVEADQAYVTLLESTASELLLALSDRGIDLPEMEALARVMEER